MIAVTRQGVNTHRPVGDNTRTACGRQVRAILRHVDSSTVTCQTCSHGDWTQTYDTRTERSSKPRQRQVLVRR